MSTEDIESTVAMVLDAISRDAILSLRSSGKLKLRQSKPPVRFTVGKHKSGFAIMGHGNDQDTKKEFSGQGAAEDCARAMVALCGAVIARKAVEEWLEKSGQDPSVK